MGKVSASPCPLFSAPQRRLLTVAAAGVLGSASAISFACKSATQGHLLGISGAAAFLLPTLLRNCRWYGPVHRRFATSKPEVWITIDDGPDPEETPAILEVLAKYQTRATFFVIGQRVKRWPHLAVAMVAAGHSVQNHTYSHPSSSFWAASPRRARREIADANCAIEDAVGLRPTQFRCPVGLANPFVHAAAAEAGLYMIGWSASGNDGVVHCPEEMPRRILRRTVPGSIILMHESRLAGLPVGVRARTLDELLQGLGVRGLSPVLPWEGEAPAEPTEKVRD